MKMLRALLALAVPLAFVAGSGASAQTKVAIGKIVGGNGLHIPSYIAMDRGFYKEEGLDARFVTLTGKPLVTATLSGNIDFVPIPSGGAQAALSGAKIKYVVGESLKSQWVIIVRAETTKTDDLKGKTIGYGRPGAADYDEGATVLARFFNLQVGRDYKVISFQAEPERIAALIRGDIDAALVSAPGAVKAKQAGLKVLVRTSDYVSRVGGTIWSTEAYLNKNQDATKKFIRAIARGVMYLRNERAGSIPILKTHLGMQDDEEAGLLWDEIHNTFGAELPPDLFREIFESRRLDMIAENQWPKEKPLPDTETFLTRDLLETTLKEMSYVPTKTDAKTN